MLSILLLLVIGDVLNGILDGGHREVQWNTKDLALFLLSLIGIDQFVYVGNVVVLMSS